MTKGAREPEDRFRIALFTAARDRCRAHPRAIRLDPGLKEAERDAMTLLFDAKLSLAEAAAVCGVKKLHLHLYRALLSLQRSAPPLEIPPFLRAG
jgi:hypothetical protein